ncbi:helix-turn-helix transcriptional regulator [Bacillus sp. FSL K6-3431]|uniref:helix-turn-helix transcriptional regulator n=1 Tax=Bacillus sp. FSL K6-3431 TaxID=2921500 RepID=UPI0030F84F2A
MLQLIAPPLPTLLETGEDTYSSGQSHPNRSQIGVFDLLIVTQGCLVMGEDQKQFHIEAMQALILYPDRHHFSVIPCESTTHFYWFHFTTSKEWSELSEVSPKQGMEYMINSNRNPFSELPFWIRLPKHCKIHNWNVVDLLCKQILSSEVESTYSSEWQRQMLFQQLLQELASTTHLEKSLPTLAVAEQAADYLRRNFSRKVSYKELGESLCYHPNHIARCMINTLGCTPIEYVNRVRLEQAKVLLVSTNWSIEKIAENCGFSQTAYFSRFFKKEEGMSPKEFKQQYVRC